MAEAQIRFQDGAGYERMMGTWSRITGHVFLDWVAPAKGLRWIDVGCGNGAFSELLVERCAPTSVDGVDPSPQQLEYARNRPGAKLARFHQADAYSLPFADASFDAAAMALVIFFVPDPPRGVREMMRVVKPGGTVCAYAWDMLGGGFPIAQLMRELRDLGHTAPLPPSAPVSRLEALRDLWTSSGLQGVEVREITVERRFESFEDLWETSRLANNVQSLLDKLDPGSLAGVQRRLREHFPPDASGRITCSARANAAKGTVPE